MVGISKAMICGGSECTFERNDRISEVGVPPYRQALVEVPISVRDVTTNHGLTQGGLDRNHLRPRRMPANPEQLEPRVQFDIAINEP